MIGMLKEQAWDLLEKFLPEKKIVIFGASIFASLLFLRYKSLHIQMVIDNDVKKQGKYFREYAFGMECDATKNILVSPVNKIEVLKSSEIIILITSMNHYKEMVEQLEKRGFYNYFILKLMEDNQPTKLLGKGVTLREQLFDTYIVNCCNRAINNKKIVLYTEGNYAGHGKQIVRQMQKFNQNLEIVWIVNDLKTELPKNFRKILRSAFFEVVYEMETAYCWIFESEIPLYIKKREGQLYFQVKHWSSITLKTFGFDFYEFRKIRNGIEICEHDVKAIDYLITGSKFDTKTCRKGFHYNGKVFEAGSARSDILFHGEKYKSLICEKYGIKFESRILLYAPTFRGGTGQDYIMKQGDIDLDFKMLHKTITETYGGEWIILFRMHPVISKESIKRIENKFVIDVSDYQDSQELVAAADMVITDYSSIMFEPAFVHKPVILFAPDRKAYINHERSLLIDYDTLPFPIAENNDKLCEAVKNFDQQEYDRELNVFFQNYGVHEDGHASERAAKFILNLIDCRGEV